MPAGRTVPPEGEREGRIRVEVVVDARALRFVERDGKSVQRLTFAAVLEGASGEFLEGKQAVMDLALSAATLADFQAKGIHSAFTFLRPKGDWRARQVVREAVENRIGAWTVIPGATLQ
jgi:hypothetical protein